MDIVNIRDPVLLDVVRKSEEARGKPKSNLDNLIVFDNRWRELSHQLQLKRSECNKQQKEIQKLRVSDPVLFQQKVQEMKVLKESIELLEQEVNSVLVLRDQALSLIGNFVHQSVPISNDESQNQVIRTWWPDQEFRGGLPEDNVGRLVPEGYRLLHHSDVMSKLGLFNAKAGANVAGHRGYFLVGYGVFLNQALIQFGLQYLFGRKFTPLQTPFFMNQTCMAKTAQLSEFDELLYSVGGEIDPETGKSEPGKYLIATSEQPISCYHQDEWMDTKSLPLRYAGYSTCFRKEAGAHGRDVAGLFRVHQFEKVEQFCITSPETSWEMHEEMLKNSEEFLQLLGIPYRVVCIVSGALNNAAAKKYDIEGWFPQTKEYRELVSCSNCTDYQSRNLLIRYGFKNDKKTQYVHMLNGTLCATERLMCCIAENYQTAEGMNIPYVLQRFLGKEVEKLIYN